MNCKEAQLACKIINFTRNPAKFCQFAFGNLMLGLNLRKFVQGFLQQLP